MNKNIKVTTCLPNHNIVQRGQPYVHNLSSRLAAADWGERIRLVYHLLRNDVLPVGQTYAEHAVSAKMPAAAAADTALRAYTVPAADTSPAFAGAPAAADMAPASAAPAPHHTGPPRPPYTAHDSDSYPATAESVADTSVAAPAAADTASASLAPAADSDTAPASVAPAADADTAPVASVADVIRVPAAARAAADTAPVTGVPAVETVLATAEPPVDDIHPATVVLAV